MAKRLTQTLIALFAALFTLAGAAFLVMPNSAQSVAYAEVQGSGTADSPWLVGTNSATSTTSGNANYENDVKAWVTENAKENEEDATTYTLHIKPTKEGAYMLSFFSSDTSAWRNTTYKTAITALEFDMTKGSLLNIGSYAFSGCSSLTSATIPDSVTSIGSSAFCGCTGLTSVTISAGVTSIEEYAFSGCTGLTSVTIPDSVMSIGNNAFYGCTGLTSITIGEGVISIGNYAFENCTNITKVAWNAINCKGIGARAFTKSPFDSSKGKITAFTFGANVVLIPAYVCYSMTALTSITIPAGVTSIGSDAFYGCTGLTGDLTIPAGVTSIGDNAFYRCIGLTNVTIGERVTSIGYSAFYGCTGLTSITIGEDVTSIGSTVFYGCTRLKSVYYTGDVAGWCNISFSNSSSNPLQYAHNLHINDTLVENLVIPDSVTSIGDYAFYYCTGLKSVTIPDSVTSIGNGAFCDCNKLTDVTIGEGVTSIGEYAFSRCTRLTSIVIPDSVTSIGRYGFYSCTGLTSIVIPDSVMSIGEYAFYVCTGLTSVTIPDSVTRIESSVFRDCNVLTDVTIPESVTSIGEYAFSRCFRLTSVTIPDSVTSIESGAFDSCIELTSIAIPNSVTSIGSSAFRGCTRLTGVTIPDSVTRMEDYTFYRCTGLKSVTIPDSVTTMRGYVFGECTGLTSVTIGEGVTSIGSDAFYGCTGLTTIAIPNSVTSIGYNAFNGCTGLTSVTIGEGVTDIIGYAFSGCTGLTSIIIPDSVTRIWYAAFANCTGLKSARIGSGVTMIYTDDSTAANNAFYGCTNLKTVINLSDLDIVAGADTYGYVAKYADKVANAKIGVNISIDASYQTGLNYYVLPEMEVAFEIDGRQYTPECTDYTVADVTYHRYSLTNVAPEDMDKTVTVKFTQDGVEFTRECSVKSYLETLAATIPTYAKLTSATLSYGVAMQAYTGKEVDSANLPTEFSGTAPEATNVNKTEDDYNKFTGASVKFTGNEYKLKFRYESEENATISATVGGEEVEVTIANGVITLEKGILPAQINSIVVVTITVGEEERASITYSVLDYVARIHAKSTDNNMKAVVVGMYNLYYEITQLLGEGA